VIGIRFDNLLGDVLLTVQRISGDNAPGQFLGPQQFGQGRDFVALVSDFALAQANCGEVGFGRDHGQLLRLKNDRCNYDENDLNLVFRVKRWRHLHPRRLGFNHAPAADLLAELRG